MRRVRARVHQDGRAEGIACTFRVYARRGYARRGSGLHALGGCGAPSCTRAMRVLLGSRTRLKRSGRGGRGACAQPRRFRFSLTEGLVRFSC